MEPVCCLINKKPKKCCHTPSNSHHRLGAGLVSSPGLGTSLTSCKLTLKMCKIGKEHSLACTVPLRIWTYYQHLQFKREHTKIFMRQQIMTALGLPLKWLWSSCPLRIVTYSQFYSDPHNSLLPAILAFILPAWLLMAYQLQTSAWCALALTLTTTLCRGDSPILIESNLRSGHTRVNTRGRTRT